MQSNSYVFGASMSPGGFAVPMSPAFGDARGGLVVQCSQRLSPGVPVQGKSRSRLRRWRRSTWTCRLRGEKMV